MADDNVTELHPAPRIPNPLMTNPLAGLSDDELGSSLLGALARIDAAQHTVRALAAERRRRDYDSGRWCGECRHGVVENPPCCWRPEPDGSGS